jgi:glutaconate CoA-transferase subunit A
MAEIVSLADGVAEVVRDGDTVAMEGFTHLIPFAAGHEVIRQGRHEPTLARMTPDVIYDQLIGAGCARRLVSGTPCNDMPVQTESIKAITCPFTGEVLTAVSSLRPDAAVVHAQRAGNVQLWGITGVHKEAVLATPSAA